MHICKKILLRIILKDLAKTFKKPFEEPWRSFKSKRKIYLFTITCFLNFRRIFTIIFKQYRGVLLVFWPTFKFLYRCLVRIENMMTKWWKLSFFWQSYLLSCKNLPFLSVDQLFLLPKFWVNFHLFLSFVGNQKWSCLSKCGKSSKDP